MNYLSKTWNGVMELVEEPFVGDLDLLHLFLLVGVVLFFIALWAIILHYVRLTAMEA